MGFDAIVILAILVFVGVAVRVIVQGISFPRGADRKASCGACGYDYSGWSRCPECGREVVEAGVLTPWLALRLRSSLGVAAALLVLVLASGALTYGALLAWITSRGYASRLLIQTLHPLTELRGQPLTAVRDYEVEITSDVAVANSGVLRGTVTVVVSRQSRGFATYIAPGTVTSAEVNVRSGHTAIRDAAGRVIATSEEFDRNAADVLYRAVGFDTADPFYSAGAESLVQFILTEVRTPGAALTQAPSAFTLGNGQSLAPGILEYSGGGVDNTTIGTIRFAGLRGEQALAGLVTTGWLVIYVALMVYTQRRCRQLLGTATPHNRTTPARAEGRRNQEQG